MYYILFIEICAKMLTLLYFFCIFNYINFLDEGVGEKES